MHGWWRIAAVAVAMVALAAFGFSSALQVSAQAPVPDQAISAIGRQVVAISGFEPFQTPLPDHIWIDNKDNTSLFYHFNKPVKEATSLLYTGWAVKGRWCVQDQEGLEKVSGKGFTHFHRNARVPHPDAGHGGSKAGEPGWWLKHVAVAEFDMPWGKVKPGTDLGFMPTKAPRCS